jgi:Protein of unknown function (DUF2934)
MEASMKSVEGVSKLPASLTTPLAVRVIFPGLLLSIILYPFLSNIPGFWNVLLTFKINNSSYSLQWGPLLLVLASVLWGSLITSLNSYIYGIYAGRLLWPQWLERWMIVRRQAKVADLRSEAERLQSGAKYNRLWYKLKAYPIGRDGDPYASAPTLLGNILAEFESYPRLRYGMDGAFYWQRIWLSLDKDRRKEIDSKWCIGDGLLYISAVCLFGAILWTAAALVSFLVWVMPEHLPFHSKSGGLIGGLLLLLVAWLVYVADLPFQRANGDTFKIVFDIYRPQILPMLAWGPAESRRWRGAWAYLNYLFIECVVCKNSYSVVLDRCDVCNYVTELSVRSLGEGQKPSCDADVPSQAVSSDGIRKRAFEIYEQRQRKEGFALEDWLRAEHELMR